MTRCSVVTCRRYDRLVCRLQGITFHRFPKKESLRRQWEERAGGEGWKAKSYSRLCSVHFEEKCFDRTGQTVRLREGSVPTLFERRAVKRPGRPRVTKRTRDAVHLPRGFEDMCFDGTCLQEVSVPSVSDSRTHLQLKPAKPPHVTETVCDVAADLPHEMCFNGTGLQAESVPSVFDSCTHVKLEPSESPPVTETACDDMANFPHEMCFNGTGLQAESVSSVFDSCTHLQLEAAELPPVTETACDDAANFPHEMEMMCESVDDDYPSDCCQEADAIEDTPVPPTVSVSALCRTDGSVVHKIFLNSLPSADERPLSVLALETPTKSNKRNVDCRVVLEKLSSGVVQAAEKSTKLVSGSSIAGAPILRSCELARAAPAQPVPQLTAQQNSFASTAAVTSLNAGARSDVSVILLRSAQPPRATASDAVDTAAATQPQDVSTLVLRMLQQQNISLMPPGNNHSTYSYENNQQGEMPVGSPGADGHAAAKLRKMVHICIRKNTLLERKLQAEREKVRRLLATVISLKSTIKQLSSE